MSAQLKNNLVVVHGKKLTTTSLIIAEVFERPHKNVLRVIDKLKARLKIEPTPYLDSQGKTQRMYELTERQALIVMPFIGGKKSLDGQEKLVDAFLAMHKLLSEPERNQAVIQKREAARFMTDSLVFCREIMDKKTSPHHCSNEHLFCNRALTGEWKAIDEATLDAYDLRLLKAIRERNTLLIQHHPKQADRKQLLDNFVTEYRVRFPRLQLVM